MLRHTYTKEEEQFLIDNVKGITLKELTKKFNEKFNLNVSERAIESRKHKLNIKSGITGGQFRKGSIPFNKGLKWDDYMSKEGQKNSLKTTYKKGNIPSNHKPIGTERRNVDGYIEVKIKDGCLNRNYEAKQRVIYRKHHGEIPDGYNVIFLDGNKDNFDIDNLDIVNKYENLVMNQNDLYQNNKELTESGLLIAKIKCKTSNLMRGLKK